MDDYLPLPQMHERITGNKYLYKNKIVLWSGNKILCEHKKQTSQCKDCGGASICEHNKIKSTCKDCGGGSICMHNIRKTRCKDCGGGSICEHKREKTRCKDCGGGSICIHNKVRSLCKTCEGGTICQHNKRRTNCKDCGGSQICEHNKRRCQICNINNYLSHLLRGRVSKALKYFNKRDKKHTFEYIGCDLEFLKKYIENKFIEGMNWENQGKWHIDHIRPCASFNLNIEEERHKCFHYTNLQPLWEADNLSKSDKYESSEDERIWDGNKWI